MPPDDTTTIRLFDKVDEMNNKMGDIALDVGVIKSALPHLATHDQVDLKIAKHAAVKKSMVPRTASGGKRTAALISTIIALAGAIVYLVQAM